MMTCSIKYYFVACTCLFVWILHMLGCLERQCINKLMFLCVSLSESATVKCYHSMEQFSEIFHNTMKNSYHDLNFEKFAKTNT